MGYFIIFALIAIGAILYIQYKDNQLESANRLLCSCIVHETSLLLKEIARQEPDEDQQELLAQYDNALLLYKERYGKNETFYMMQDKLNMVLEKQERK